jgi:hypothetical protein
MFRFVAAGVNLSTKPSLPQNYYARLVKLHSPPTFQPKNVSLNFVFR